MHGGIAGEQETVVEIPASAFVLFQKVPAVERTVAGVAAHIAGDHGTRLARICQTEAEHQLKKLSICGFLLHALGAEAACGLICRKLLCAPRDRRSVGSALVRIGNTDDLPPLLIHLFEKQKILINLSLEIVHIDHGFVRGRAGTDDLHILGIRGDGGVVRQGQI